MIGGRAALRGPPVRAPNHQRRRPTSDVGP